MVFQQLMELKDEVRVGFAIIIAEKILLEIEKTDERYIDGRAALDKCWIWVENKGISGDDLYELIDNAECRGISEFAEKENDKNIARLWSLFVDVVAYTSWTAFKREKMKYLPQMIEGIKENSLIILIESAIETTFITKEEIEAVAKQLISKYCIKH